MNDPVHEVPCLPDDLSEGRTTQVHRQFEPRAQRHRPGDGLPPFECALALPSRGTTTARSTPGARDMALSEQMIQGVAE